MRIRLATLNAALLFCALAAEAGATPYTDLTAFTADAGSLALVDFNAAPNGDIGNTYSALGVSFSPGNHFAQCLGFTTSPPGCWVSDSADPLTPGLFEATFSAAGITAVGVNNALNADLATLRVYDSANNLLDSVSSDALNGTLDFFGVITSTSIARLTIEYSAPVDGWAVDDLRFGTPEPSSILLMASGLATLFGSARRRKRSV